MPGIFHYAPYRHRLERRCELSTAQWERITDDLPAPCLLIGLSSIYWRESWKYGERAFRYCHHDVGHAIGAVVISARTLGWQVRLLDGVADEDLNRLFGTLGQTGVEAEHADCLFVLNPAGADEGAVRRSELSCEQWRSRIPDVAFTGETNRLSKEHHHWPVIDDVSRATRKSTDADTSHGSIADPAGSPALDLIPARRLSAERIIRQRRSAVAMDGRMILERTVFYQMLQRILPEQFPFHAVAGPPNVSLAIFVHRVVDLAPGLYVLARTEAHESALRKSLKSEFEWQRPEQSPRALRLYRLLADDMRRAAKVVSCHQDIAADGAFSLGMLAEFDTLLAAGNEWRYPRLYWECGLIGQVLYLEAEAAGIRATGIGCFFDDVMHDLLGIADRRWQSLYHFTVGGPVEDSRLKTIAPYAHLNISG